MTLASSHVKFLAAGGVMALAVAYLMLTSLNSTAVYYLTVGELLARGVQGQAQPVRVSGTVAPGSIVREQGGLAIHFLVEDQSGQVPVTYRGGTVPDIFSDQVEVVVEGKLGPDGTFAANTLLAKCPSRFEDGSSPPVASG